MHRKLFNLIGLHLLLFLMMIGHVSAQTSGIPAISPAMLSQFGSMSSSAKMNLASQYGVNLDELGMGSDINGLSQDQGITADGVITSEADQVLYQRIIDAESNTKKAKDYRRNNIPIFERDYSSISELPIYGQFLFDGEYSTFAPMNNVPVPSNYVIGPGDSLRVLLYGIEDSGFNLVVNRDGSIDFPELGSFNVAGMPFDEASNYIKTRVSKQLIGSEVSISIGRLRSINIFMSGETTVPGAYSVSGLSTVSQLLFVAGGVTEIGSLRNIEVRRANKLIAIFDLYELLVKGNSSGDIRLQSGDIVFVPAAKKTISIDGAVKRPGKYELKEDEKFEDLIPLVGGFENRAYLKQIQIERYDQNTDIPSIINLDLTNKNNLNFEISDGDIIRVAEVTDRLSNSVILKGAVKRPGQYGWYEGIRLTDIINSINIDFANNFDMGKGLIVRRKNINNYDIETVDFDIRSALDRPKTNMDPLLELYDEILIFSLGYNDDSLNDNAVYDPDEDIDHPLFGREVDDQDTEELVVGSSQIDSQALYNQNSNQLFNNVSNEMTDEELRVQIYESKKANEYNLINQGKRRILLEPVIDKLKQQASSLESSKIISISGAVKVPGQYPLTKDSTYIDLINLAGGYKDDAHIQAAEIRRTIVDESGSMVIRTSNADLNQLANTKIESRDHLHIRTVKDWDARDTVILGGEVFYPGAYLISPNETLSSVLKRAGGFTNESFIGGAIFTRESIKQKEREQLQILGDAIRRDQAARSMTKESEDFSVSSSEVEASISALLSSAVYGRLIIDIPRLMSGDGSADIVLQDGDVLMVPKFTNAVTVVGEVRRSGSFVLQDSYEIEDYLQLAAGMTARGDKEEIYIIRADGSVRKSEKNRSFLTFEDQSNAVQAGDTIVIPIKSSYQTPLNLYSTVSQVVFQSIASIAAFSTILN